MLLRQRTSRSITRDSQAEIKRQRPIGFEGRMLRSSWGKAAPSERAAPAAANTQSPICMLAARRSWDLRDVISWLKAGVAKETRTRGIGTTALAEIVLRSMAVTIYSAVLHIATVYSSVSITSTSEPGSALPRSQPGVRHSSALVGGGWPSGATGAVLAPRSPTTAEPPTRWLGGATQLIFEGPNSTGVDLSQSDLIAISFDAAI